MTGIEESNTKVGRYSVEERKDRILRYLKKRNQRNFNKTIKVSISSKSSLSLSPSIYSLLIGLLCSMHAGKLWPTGVSGSGGDSQGTASYAKRKWQ